MFRRSSRVVVHEAGSGQSLLIEARSLGVPGRGRLALGQHPREREAGDSSPTESSPRGVMGSTRPRSRGCKSELSIRRPARRPGQGSSQRGLSSRAGRASELTGVPRLRGSGAGLHPVSQDCGVLYAVIGARVPTTSSPLQQWRLDRPSGRTQAAFGRYKRAHSRRVGSRIGLRNERLTIEQDGRIAPDRRPPLFGADRPRVSTQGCRIEECNIKKARAAATQYGC